jgi:hypothetical protein
LPPAAAEPLYWEAASVTAGAGAGAFFCGRLAAVFFAGAPRAFLAAPAALSFRLGFEASGVAFDGGLECFTGEFFAAPEDACKLTASFTRVIAAFASRSISLMWGALAEYRSVTSDINASILASRLRALFVFMTTPLSQNTTLSLAFDSAFVKWAPTFLPGYRGR